MNKWQTVTSGQKLEVPASTWNALMKMGREWEASGRSGALAQRNTRRDGVMCLIKNTTASAVDAGRVMEINDVVIAPADNETEFNRRLMVDAAAASAASVNLVITGVPIPAGSIGLGYLAGVATAEISVSDESHTHAVPAATGIATSATAGPLRILWKESGTGQKWAYLAFRSMVEIPDVPTDEDIQDVIDNYFEGEARFMIMELATASGTVATFDDFDCRGRFVDIMPDINDSADSAAITPVHKRISPVPAADVTLVTDSPYTLTLDYTDGSLVLTASAAAAEPFLAWVRISPPYAYAAPATCPCTSWPPASWPCGGLVEEYTISNAFTSLVDGATIASAAYYYSDQDGTGTIVDYVETRILNDSATATAYATSSCTWRTAYGTLQVRSSSNVDPLAWETINDPEEEVGFYEIVGFWAVLPYGGNGDVVGSKDTGLTPVGNYVEETFQGASLRTFGAVVVS